ncbi:RNA polymerase sigma-70 factor [Actinocorallia sp. API 0066]|uniref:RNA polymerase sigma-70 factor n=1 Tax=Actinocorallia sp. API 0066 TaxID=2896846 RepID=UPI001E5592F0|nr:RNA polymerase sigma-70 factor [Actinocorallia sp. API 0066]MCD0448181.1 RNA polymerase sigma-70 factor [Actinocorallia sp. API 0066]
MSISNLYSDLRPRAFVIAYQMLGSVSEAEDAVQEAFLRIHQTLQRDEQIESPQAYLTTVVTRIAVDHLRSARARREHYVGEWLPEPLATGSLPAEQAEMADSLSLAFLVLLESLTPRQRAAFLLREVFEYPYAEVARIVGTDVDSARHLVARARNQVRQRRSRYHASRRRRDELARRFFAAAEHGDLPALEKLLADEVTLYVDGGGKAPALMRPVSGLLRVARSLVGATSALAARGMRVVTTDVNGQPGAVTVDADGRLIGVLGLDVAGDRIRAIHFVANPDKLRHLERAGRGFHAPSP